MPPRTQQRQQPHASGTASTVHTTTDDPTSITANFPRTLRLRGASQSEAIDTESSGQEEERSSSRRVRWDETVVNNEGMGKKSSKVCCIYHRPRALDESSSESSDSDSSSSDDSDNDNDMRATRRPGRRGDCGHDHDHDHDHDHPVKRAKRRRPSPNAYEKIPKNDRKHATTNKVA